jgi:hypothetical protein
VKVVRTKLLGGLGNQMFQYAAARALADRTGSQLLLDVGEFANYTLRRYELDAMSVRARVEGDATQPAAPPPPPGPLALAAKGLWRRLFPDLPEGVPLYRERSFAFDAGLLQQRPPVQLEGYWQSEKYFHDAADAIRRDFTVAGEPDAGNRAVLQRMQGTTPVSLHVRRGDYVTNATTAAYHGTCSPEYYRQAVDHIARRCGPVTLFVFSDDQDWTRANLPFPHPTVHVDCNPPDRGVWDMHLMKHCRHHVVANSSFSWWGAWLNPSPDKIVVAPRRWFTDPAIDTSDLVPAGWVRI